MSNRASGRGDADRDADHIDEGVSMDPDEACKDWTAVAGAGVRNSIGNGNSHIHSRNSSAGDSDFVSQPGDIDTNCGTSPNPPSSIPACDHSGSDSMSERDNDARAWGLNPFVNDVRIRSWQEAVTVTLMTIFIMPVRLLLTLIFLFISWGLACLGTSGLSASELKEFPISGWRLKLRAFVCLTMRAMFVFGGFHWITVKGKRADPKEAPILVAAPHSTYFDTLGVVKIGAPGLVAKGDIEQSPVLGALVGFTQPIYVWREDPNSRQNTLKEIKRRVASSDPWPQLLLFPEGTCTNREALITFKPGAFHPGLPVQPVLFRYPGSEGENDNVTWSWKGSGWANVFWRTLTQWNTNCEIEYLSVYNPSDEEKRDPILFAKNVREVMAKALDVPTLDYTFEDCRVMNAAEDAGLPYHVGLIEAFNLCRSLGMTTENLLAQVRVFADYADKTSGLFRLERFAKVLDLSLTYEEMAELLTLAGVTIYDDDMTFPEFLQNRKPLMDLLRLDERLKQIYRGLMLENGQEGAGDAAVVWDHVDRRLFLGVEVKSGFDAFKTAVLADSHLIDVLRNSLSEKISN